MAGSPGLQQRQKEMARREKQHLKEARRRQRKQERVLGLAHPEEAADLEITMPEPGQPRGDES